MPWPLSKPMLSGYTLSEGPRLMRTPMDQGPDRITRLTTQYTTMITARVFLYSRAELQTYRDFFAGSEAKHGAGWFDMDLITTNGVVAHAVRIAASTIVPSTHAMFELQLSLETEEHLAS